MESNHDKLHAALEHLYLDWVNNFLSIESYAAHYGLSVEHAKAIIAAGKAGSIWN